jgi:hypothetical protein
MALMKGRQATCTPFSLPRQNAQELTSVQRMELMERKWEREGNYAESMSGQLYLNAICPKLHTDCTLHQPISAQHHCQQIIMFFDILKPKANTKKKQQSKTASMRI